MCVVGNGVEAKLGVRLHHEVLLALDRRVELRAHVMRRWRLALIRDEAHVLIDLFLLLLAGESWRSHGAAIVGHLLAVDELAVLG